MLAAKFNPFPFTHDARNAIFTRRSVMSDELVFDLLLEQASIASPQSMFPPDSPDTLLDLLDAIAKCPWDALKKSCLFFYLLSYVSSDVAAEYGEIWALPAQFVHLAHACFLLDSGTPDDLARAVALLSDARIVQDLSSKIMHTLSLAPEPASSRLVRTYVRSVSPVLEAYEDLAIYLTALLEYSLADAWTFQRSFSETTPLRNQLFRTVLDRCLIRKSHTSLSRIPQLLIIPQLQSPPSSPIFSLYPSQPLNSPSSNPMHSHLQKRSHPLHMPSSRTSSPSVSFTLADTVTRSGSRAPLTRLTPNRTLTPLRGPQTPREWPLYTMPHTIVSR